MKKLLFVIGLLWAGGSAGLWYWSELRNQRIEYRGVAIRRGNLLATVSATGTVEPEAVVDVGAQIAGVIERFGTDPRDPTKPISYGSPVAEGTVLAHLADALFKARVDQARASLGKSEADVLQARAKLQQAERDYERAKRLKTRDQISPLEYDSALAAFETARASQALAESSVALATANLEEASVNLGYTTIRSPVKGVILDRRVNIGQTVVASLNAHSLFLIAKDLSNLEIWSSVNETDIGSIHEGQKVRFTVASLPRETFEGKVSQIRLNASMAQNVVTYTVVISVDNSAGRILPYLTARLQFEVEAREGVLLVPNGALRWQPRVQNVVPEAREAYSLALRHRAPEKGETGHSDSPSEHEPGGVLWIRQGDFVRPVKVSVGLSDGISTEILGGGLKEGEQIVVGVNRIGSDPDALSILPHTWSQPPKK
jgi:HlyD family secretion protein